MEETKRILYADDDPDDKAWISEACRAVNCRLKIDFVENGKQVLEQLQGLEPDNMPRLIVLDLNMPVLDGRQTLQRLKADQELRSIPVAIVTTSTSKLDKEVCMRLGASLFLSKPDTHADWQQVIRDLEPFVA